jgi:membrane-associated phospholipid phosphatase
MERHAVFEEGQVSITGRPGPVQRTIKWGLSFWAGLAVFAGHPSRLAAQFRADSTWRDIRRVGGDIWGVWTSPVHAKARDAEGFAAFAGIVGASAALDEPLYRWVLDHPNAWPLRVLHPLRETAHYKAYMIGTGAYVIPISTAMYLAGVMSKSRGLRDAGMGCLAADLTIAGVRQTIFLFVQRDRPVISPDDAFRFRFPGTQELRYQSFFSGHIANSMGCSSFLSHRFALHAGEPLLYGFVTALGAGRVVDGQHWLSDTVIGGLFGYVVGRTISGRFAARERTSALQPMAVRFSWRF